MKKSLLIVSILFLASCKSDQYIPDLPNFSGAISNLSEVLSPEIYKKDINQGSVLRMNKFKEIKLGMNQEEVANLIGTPSINDVFHKDQWDYIHHSILKDDKVLSSRVTLIFDKGKLVDILKTNDSELLLIEEKNINLDSFNNPDNEIKNPSDWFKFW